VEYYSDLWMKNWRGFGRIPLWPIFTQISQHLSGHIIGKKEKLSMGISVFKPKIETYTFPNTKKKKKKTFNFSLL